MSLRMSARVDVEAVPGRSPYQRFRSRVCDGDARPAQPKRPSTYSRVRGSGPVTPLREQVLGRADLDALAAEEEGGAVGEASRLLHEVGDKHDRHLRACSVLQHVLDAHRRHRVDGDGELVEEQQVGFLRQGTGDRQTLLLTAREQAAERVAVGPSPRPRARLARRQRSTVSSRSRLLPGCRASHGDEGHVVVDAQRQPDGQREDDADACGAARRRCATSARRGRPKTSSSPAHAHATASTQVHAVERAQKTTSCRCSRAR